MTQTARQVAIANENRAIDESTARATEAAKPRTAIEALASRLSVSSGSLQNTLKNTVFKGCSEAEFVALVIVANTYNLNPLLREIYAFPKKGGGIQAIVGYDGWIRIANDHPQFDGIEFVHIEDGNGNLKAIEGVLHRKDRQHPTKKMIYLKEFKRNTEPWNNSPHHMLDVRCFCHTVRLGLGVSLGIEDDESLYADGGTLQGGPAVVPSSKSLGEELGDEIPNFDKPPVEYVDADTGEITTDPATGMTEVDEETARKLDAGEAVGEYPAGDPHADYRGEATPQGTSRNQTWFNPETGKLRYAHHTPHGVKWCLEPQEDEPEPAQQSQAEAAAETVAAIDGPLNEAPAYAARVEQIRSGINLSPNKAALDKVEAEYLNHAASLPDEVKNEIEGLLREKRKAVMARP